MSSQDLRIRWGVAAICRGAKNDAILIDKIRNLGGYIRSSEIRSEVFKRLREHELGFIVKLSLKRGTGGVGKNMRRWSIFKPEYIEKTFFCLNRTAFLKLLFLTLKKPEEFNEKCVLTHWLKRHCTEAERLAVMWHLGFRNFSSSMRKRNIQVDGILKPIKRLIE